MVMVQENHTIYVDAKKRLYEILIPLNLCYIHQNHQNILHILRHLKWFCTNKVNELNFISPLKIKVLMSFIAHRLYKC